MNKRQISIVSLILAVLTGIWIISMVLLVQERGSFMATFKDAYDFVRDPGGLFYLTYLNVVVITMLDVVLFGMGIIFWEG
jgi:hypothetical protein